MSGRDLAGQRKPARRSAAATRFNMHLNDMSEDADGESGTAGAPDQPHADAFFVAS
jgi:hypothetical protein